MTAKTFEEWIHDGLENEHVPTDSHGWLRRAWDAGFAAGKKPREYRRYDFVRGYIPAGEPRCKHCRGVAYHMESCPVYKEKTKS